MTMQDRIAEYIRNTGIKQSSICEKTGINKDAMSAMMRGERRMTANEFETICIAIGKEPNDFASWLA